MKWKTWKKFGVIAMAVIMGAAFLAGCGSDSNNASSANKKELTYSKSQGPYSDLFEKGIKPILEKKGYKVNGKDMSDLLQADVYQSKVVEVYGIQNKFVSTIIFC